MIYIYSPLNNSAYTHRKNMQAVNVEFMHW